MINRRKQLPKLLLTAVLVFCLSLSGCKKAETVDPELLRIYSMVLPKDLVLYSEDGGIWCRSNKSQRKEPGKYRGIRWGPVFLPETEDIGKTFSLHITGIRKYDWRPEKAWWLLDYTLTLPNLAHQKDYWCTLLIQLGGNWYELPRYYRDLYDTVPDAISDDNRSKTVFCNYNLLMGFDSNVTQQVIPGHYRFIIFRQWNGKTALDVEEFDLLETEDGYAIDNIRKPTSEELFAQEAWIPSRNIRDLDGRAWHMSEADRLYFVQDSNTPVDILETEETPVPIVVVE